MTGTAGQVITFYSYKGGVGRTFALADIAVILARWGHRVLCVDWDLEAPGLESYFKEWLAPQGDGLLELLLDYRPDAAIDWTRVIETPSIPQAQGRLALLRAGRIDGSYATRVQSVDWDELYSQGFGRALEAMRSEWQRQYDFVLIDSRTGLSDIGGICTIQLPSLLVTLFTPNEQSIDGVLRVARGAQEKQKTLPVDRAPLRVVPVPTRIDSTEYEARKTWTRRIAEQLGPLIAEWSEAPGSAEAFLEVLSVPYVPYWSYGEQLPALKDESRDRLSVGFAHETLAALFVNNLAGAPMLLLDRERVVAEANITGAGGGFRYDVFVSYSRPDSEFAMAIGEALRARGLSVYSENDLRPGDRIGEKLTEARATSRVVVVIVGESLVSNHLLAILGLESVVGALTARLHPIIPIFRVNVDFQLVPQVLKQYVGLFEAAPPGSASEISPVDRLATEIVEAVRSR